MALITPFLICGANRQKLHFGASGASRKRTRFLWQQEISYYWTADGMLPILASCVIAAVESRRHYLNIFPTLEPIAGSLRRLFPRDHLRRDLRVTAMQIRRTFLRWCMARKC